MIKQYPYQWHEQTSDSEGINENRPVVVSKIKVKRGWCQIRWCRSSIHDLDEAKNLKLSFKKKIERGNNREKNRNLKNRNNIPNFKINQN